MRMVMSIMRMMIIMMMRSMGCLLLRGLGELDVVCGSLNQIRFFICVCT